MTTIEQVERTIVAASMDSRWSSGIDVKLLEDETAVHIATAAKLMVRNDAPISISSLELKLQEMNKEVPSITVREIFRIFISNRNKEDDYINEFKSILLTRMKKNSLIRKIDKVKSLVLEEKYDEAIALVKSLRFQTTGRIDTSMSWIAHSLTNTNGFSSGYNDIDDNGGLLKKNMMTITGDSGSQKTMFAQALCLRILRTNPEYRCIFFEKEMPLEDLGRRIASWILRVDSNELMRTVSTAKSIVERNDKLIKIAEDMSSRMSADKELKSIVSRLELVSRDDFGDAIDIWKILTNRKPDVWVLDFFTMLEPKSGGFDDDTMRQQAVMLKNAVLDTNSLGIILSQLKQSNNVDQRSNKIPLIGDMEWGKHLRQYSTWVFAILYPSYYKIRIAGKDTDYFFLISRKTRHGKEIVLPLHSKPATADFFEPNEKEKKTMLTWLSSYMHAGDNHDKFK